MPRKLRVEYPGAVYHIMSRGDRREDIFLNDVDRTNYFFTRDHLGSVREMTDGAGAIRARYDYDPYGRRTKVSGDLDADFGFTGHYVHAPSGLYMALFRAYD